MMRFRVLGPVEADPGTGALPLGGPRHRVLLAALLTAPGVVVAADRLIEALWGDAPPSTATALLHVRVSELRARIGAELIVTRRPGYLLDVDPDRVDAHRFAEEVADGRRALAAGDAAGAAAVLRAALGRWRGPAFAEIADRDVGRPHAVRLENLRAQAVEDRITADLGRGAHRDVLAELEALVGEQPLHEGHRRQLMLALYRGGQQGAALELYRRGADLLREELGVDPDPALQDLQVAILRQESRLDARPPRAVPLPLTSFVGRDAEVADVAARLGDARLVTLTGVGGAGKSRLAVEVARARDAAFPDGVAIVELAPLGDPALVPATVAAAVGARERPQQPLPDAIAAHVGASAMLLVIDNCEHVVAAVAGLAGHLLARCPRLRVLCTSRERLGLTGEVVLAVSGLAVPAPGSGDVAAVPAVQLFVDRARAVQPRFLLTGENATAVAEVTRGLDGLPLSIELAAARTAVLGVQRIASGLSDRFRLLTHGSRDAQPRHQTLRAVVDWSYGLLSPAEQRTFDRLAVFVGGFTYDAAVAVAGPEAAEHLDRLVDKSLVVTEATATGDYRYRLLETLSAYGMAALERHGDTDARYAAHAAHYLDLATAAVPGLRSARLATWLDRLAVEHGNLRAAMERSLRGGADATAAGIAAALYAFWDLRGHYAEGREWLRRVLEPGRTMPDATRARALMGAATLAVIQGDLADATVACQDAADLSRVAGDGAGLAHALQYLGFVATLAGEYDRARLLIEDSEQVADAAGAGWEHAWSFVFRAALALSEGRFADAGADGRRAAETTGEDGDQELLAWVDLVLGIGGWGTGGPAAHHIARGVARFGRLHGLWGISLGLLATGLVLVDAGRDADAVAFFGAAESVRLAAGVGAMPYAEAWMAAALPGVRERLAPDRFAAAWTEGFARSADEAVQAALDELTTFPS